MKFTFQSRLEPTCPASNEFVLVRAMECCLLWQANRLAHQVVIVARALGDALLQGLSWLVGKAFAWSFEVHLTDLKSLTALFCMLVNYA